MKPLSTSALDPAHVTLIIALNKTAEFPLLPGAAFKLGFAAEQIYNRETRVGQIIPAYHEALVTALTRLRDAVEREGELNEELAADVNAAIAHIHARERAHAESFTKNMAKHAACEWPVNDCQGERASADNSMPPFRGNI